MTDVLSDDPLWYKDAIIYEVQLRSFYDSNGDGVGDLPGLTAKLDYLADLGVTALWLLPFYPSPLKDDGYDIADYTRVDPALGTLKDFKTFLREAHARGLRVITELVLNHTSDQHPWFQRARHAPAGSAERDYYVWSDTPDKYPGVRIIFQDFEASNWTWDPVAKAYFWHRFYSSQPDLNFDNPKVRQAMFRVLDQWFALGVDGMRLDAVPYLFERDGTNCENLPETHTFLKEVRAHVDRKHPNRMLLAEANMWPEDAVSYMGDGDECHMNYHFPLMPRLFMAIEQEDRFPIVDILEQTPEIPETCQWGMFLRNHDELTLEMVTDRERDYMYRTYAADQRARINLGIRRRLAPLLQGHRGKVELLHALLFSLPGTPIVYYGDEIGMGDNIYLGDRNGVRTPMQWSSDRNAGFSRANPQKLNLPVIIDPHYHYEAVNVELQQRSPASLLWWFKRVIALRKRYRAFGRGTLTMLQPENRKVLAFVRELGEQRILCVFNLSRHVQAAALDLSAYVGQVPVELLGQTELPPVGEAPYLFTVGGHSFYWLALESSEARAQPEPASLPALAGERDPLSWWEGLRGDGPLGDAILGHLDRSGLLLKRERGQRVVLREWIPLDTGGPALVLLDVTSEHAPPEPYQLVLGLARRGDDPPGALAQLTLRGDQVRVVHEAVGVEAAGRGLLQAFASKRRFKGQRGSMTSEAAGDVRRALSQGDEWAPHLTEASNAVLVYGDSWLVKLYRRPRPGDHTERELAEFLRAAGFDAIPRQAGQLRYEPDAGEAVTLASLQHFQSSEGDCWDYALGSLSAYFEDALTQEEAPGPFPGLLAASQQDPPDLAHQTIGHVLEGMRRLGQRTAELHAALASRPDLPAFAPHPFSKHDRRALYQGLRSLTGRVLLSLEARQEVLPEALRPLAAQAVASRARLLDRFAPLIDHALQAARIRTHGHLHLGQVLNTGRDFVFTDFEGDPSVPLSERRLKRSALSDLASLLASLEHVSHVAYSSKQVRDEDVAALVPWRRYWVDWTRAALLRGYREAAADGVFFPDDPAELRLLLDALLLEHALEAIEVELHKPGEYGTRLGLALETLLEEGP